MAHDIQSEKRNTDTAQAHEPTQPVYRYQSDDNAAPSVTFTGAAKNAASAETGLTTGNVRFG